MKFQKINLIIGKNGAGKSRTLKEIMLLRRKEPNSIYTYWYYYPFILKALRLVCRDITEITITSTTSGHEINSIVELTGGTRRIVEIFSTLLNNNKDYMYIDGLEKDLHHTVFVELWKILFTMSYHLGTEIYVTTQSIDCINAFIKVKLVQDHISSCLVRIDNSLSGRVFKVFDNETLRAAVELNGDLR